MITNTLTTVTFLLFFFTNIFKKKKSTGTLGALHLARVEPLTNGTHRGLLWFRSEPKNNR